MANGWAPFIGLVVVAIFCAAAWFGAPKGENQTIWRSTLILSAVSMYLMWAITLTAQLHPLISPIRFLKKGDSLTGRPISCTCKGSLTTWEALNYDRYATSNNLTPGNVPALEVEEPVDDL